MTALQGTERLQVRGRGGKGQWCNIRKTNRHKWFYKALTNSIYSPKLKTCACASFLEWKLILQLRMKSVWWVVRIFFVRTTFTKQRNTDVHFSIATLRPSHQSEWLPQGRTDIQAFLPITENPGWMHALHPTVNCSIPKVSAYLLSNHTWQSIFSEATEHSLKGIPSVCQWKASHLSISALVFTGSEAILKKNTLSMSPLKNAGRFVTECKCAARPKWTFTWEAPKNCRPHTVSYRQPFCTSLILPYSKSRQTQHANIPAFQPVKNKCFFLLFFNDRAFPLNFHALAQIILQSP